MTLTCTKVIHWVLWFSRVKDINTVCIRPVCLSMLWTHHWRSCMSWSRPAGVAVSPLQPAEDTPPPPLCLHAAGFRKRKQECRSVFFRKVCTSLTVWQQRHTHCGGTWRWVTELLTALLLTLLVTLLEVKLLLVFAVALCFYVFFFTTAAVSPVVRVRESRTNSTGQTS